MTNTSFRLRHSWCHIIYDFLVSDENCRNHKTLAEEDMLGKITKLASAVHGATVCQRFFERFRLFMGMHWEKLSALPPADVEQL